MKGHEPDQPPKQEPLQRIDWERRQSLTQDVVLSIQRLLRDLGFDVLRQVAFMNLTASSADSLRLEVICYSNESGKEFESYEFNLHGVLNGAQHNAGKSADRIQEGKKKKGGTNNPPTGPRPQPPKGQGKSE